MIKKGRLLNFVWIGFIFATLILLAQYLSVKWSEKIKEKISEVETPGRSIEVKE